MPIRSYGSVSLGVLLPAMPYNRAAETTVYEQQVAITNIIFVMLRRNLIIKILHASQSSLLKSNSSCDMRSQVHERILEIGASFSLISLQNRGRKKQKVPVLQLCKYTEVSLFYFILYSAKYKGFYLRNLTVISITLEPVQFSMF